MDVHSAKQRSYNMSRIKGVNTKPEIIVRKYLWGRGYRYRLHQKGLPGKPDITFPGRSKAIFVHGCFWHRHCCRFFKWPATNEDFWKNKINGNVKRDNINYEKLTTSNWDYFVVWECELRSPEKNGLWKRLEKFLDSN